MFRQALAMRIKVLGVYHFDTYHSLIYLGSLLHEQRKLAEAEAVYRDLLALQRSGVERIHRWQPETLLTLARLLTEEGRTTEAEALTSEAAQVYRDTAATGDVHILKRLAWLLATSAYPKVRDGHSAVGFGERAASATDRKDPKILDTLAAAYAEAGQFTNAARVEKEAMAIVANEPEGKEFSTRLKLYEANTPYHKMEIGVNEPEREEFSVRLKVHEANTPYHN
jgi:tetratricopeptide (TPR) repeat protein